MSAIGTTKIDSFSDLMLKIVLIHTKITQFVKKCLNLSKQVK